jgi:uncharacterized protein GlcG (DUF336 family)
MKLTTESVEQMIEAGQQQATKIGVPVSIAVLDAAGHLKAFLRMDGAVLGSIDIALKKAKTAVLFGLNSEAIFEYCKPGAHAYGLEQTNGGLAVFAGGIPLKTAQGDVIGAVGISGGTLPQDFSIAQAAAAGWTI